MSLSEPCIVCVMNIRKGGIVVVVDAKFLLSPR